MSTFADQFDGSGEGKDQFDRRGFEECSLSLGCNGSLLLSDGNRQSEGKNAAGALRTRCPDGTALARVQLFGNAQAEPQAFAAIRLESVT